MPGREKIMDYRGKRSQGEMADKYGVTQQTWSNWENGKSHPNAIIMKKMEIDSGVPMEQLFFDLFNKNNLLESVGG